MMIQDRLESTKCRILPRWHFTMLNDEVRNLFFKTAIQKRTQSLSMNANVLDIGTGTGLMAFFAEKANAKKVVKYVLIPV
jgi:predicted RNA methylase